MGIASDRLKAARERAGFASASDAARAFGWVESTYLAHENASRGIRGNAAARYAKAFKITIAELVSDENSYSPPLFGARVVGEVEYGSFRTDESSVISQLESVHVAVPGFSTEDLLAYKVVFHSGVDQYLIAAPTRITGLRMEDMVIATRTVQNLTEIAAWTLTDLSRGVAAMPAFRPRGRDGDPILMNSDEWLNLNIIGVVVARFELPNRTGRTLLS